MRRENVYVGRDYKDWSRRHYASGIKDRYFQRACMDHFFLESSYKKTTEGSKQWKRSRV